MEKEIPRLVNSSNKNPSTKEGLRIVYVFLI